MTVKRNYAIGPSNAPKVGYSQGVFSNFKTAINQVGKSGDFVWRLEDNGTTVNETRIRFWNVSEGEWAKLEVERTDSDKQNEFVEFHHNLRKPISDQDYAKGGVIDSDRLQLDVEILRKHKPEPQTEYTNDVDLAYFERGLKFTKNTMDDALLEQSSLFQQVSDRYAVALSRRDQAKDEIKQLEGRLYVQIRLEMEGKGEKPTEALLAARINSHPARIEAVQKHSRAVEECGRWEGMKDAYKDRGYAIKVMADLYAAGYWSTNSAQGADYRQKNADYDQNQEIRRNAYKERNRR